MQALFGELFNKNTLEAGGVGPRHAAALAGEAAGAPAHQQDRGDVRELPAVARESLRVGLVCDATKPPGAT